MRALRLHAGAETLTVTRYTYEDELSPTQQQLVDMPMGQGNRFRSYEVLEDIPRMPSYVSIEDDFVGSEGLAELSRKVQLLQDGVREELEKRDKGMRKLQGRITEGRDKVEDLAKGVEKERKARVTLFEKRKDDEKTVQALKDELAEAKTTIQALGTELAEEKAARQAIEKRLEKCERSYWSVMYADGDPVEHAFGEIIQTRESDDDADHLGEQRGKKRARPC